MYIYGPEGDIRAGPFVIATEAKKIRANNINPGTTVLIYLTISFYLRKRSVQRWAPFGSDDRKDGTKIHQICNKF